MSKKSRKRNKKILAALALAGGAAMVAKGRGKGVSQGVSGADKAAFTSDPAYSLPKTDYITKKADVVEPAATVRREPFGKMSVAGIPGQDKRALYATRADAPKGIIGPMGYTQPFGGITPKPRGFQGKGGGIAKRGMGAAYKSGGRVKSMGIAKRGGGIAKR